MSSPASTRLHLALTVNGEARRSRGRAVQDAARGAARGPAAHRHQARLRAGRVRRLRGAARRRAGAVVPGRWRPSAKGARSRPSRGWQDGAELASAAGALRRSRRGAVRLLHAGHPPRPRRRCSSANPNPTRDEIAEALSGQPLPLHRLPADLRGGRSGRGRIGDGRAVSDRTTSHGGVDRQAAPPRRRPRQGHRPDALRRRPAAAAHACTASCCARRCRTRASARVDARAARALRRACSWCSPARTSRSPSASCRSRQDEHPLCPDRVRFVGDPVAAVIAARRADGVRGARSHRRRLRAAAHHRRRRRRRCDTPEPRIHDYGDEGNVHKKVSLRVRRRRRGARRRRPRLRGRLLLRGQHPPADRAARHARRRSIPTAS